MHAARAGHTKPCTDPVGHGRQRAAASTADESTISHPARRRHAKDRHPGERSWNGRRNALIDCGVDPAQVIRAALRRAVKNWQLGLDFVPPSEEQRTRITEWRARTSLAVDTEALTALLRAHDPLDVLSKWTLIRGQVEPRVWAEIDTILDEIAENAAVPREGGDH